jgi:hypothetical protein
MFHQLLRCQSVAKFLTIRRDGDSNRLHQLGKTLITRPYEFVHHSRGLPFALFEDEFGQSREARGMADAR